MKGHILNIYRHDIHVKGSLQTNLAKCHIISRGISTLPNKYCMENIEGEPHFQQI